MRAFRALTLNMVRASFRNRTALIFTLGLAFLFMFIFGELVSGSASVSLDVVDHDHSAASAAYISVLKHVSPLVITVTSQQTALADLKDSNAEGVIVIPKGLQAAVHSSGPHVRIGLLEPTGAETSTGPAVQDIVDQVTMQIVARIPVHGQTPPPPVVTVAQPTTVGTHQITRIDYFMPAMAAYIILQSGINFVAISLVELRVRQVLRRLRATPLSRGTILAAQVTGGALTVLLQVIIVVAVGMVIFGARVYGNWAVAAVPTVLGIAAFVGIGFMLTSAVRTSEAARGLSTMVALPMMFLSGIFFPISDLPTWLQTAVHIFPLTWLNDALHQVLNNGASLGDIMADCLVLLGWAIVTFVIAVWRFRWE